MSFAVDYLFQRMAPGTDEIPNVGIVAFGSGAVAALAAVGREKGGTEIIRVFSGDSAGGSGFVTIPPLNVKYLRFLIAVEPQSLETLLRHCVQPTTVWLVSLLLPVVNRLCQDRGGFPLGIMPLLRFVREVNIPVMVVQGSCDSTETQTDAQWIYDNLPGPKQQRIVENASGCSALYQSVVD